MARDSISNNQRVQQLVAAFLSLSVAARVALIFILLAGAGAFLAFNHFQSQPETNSTDAGAANASPESSEADDLGGNIPPPAASFARGSRSIFFCVWNMENLFDDRDDNRPAADAQYDKWFARDPEVRKEKYQHIAQALLKMNDGRGPDIIVGNEMESMRSAELLKETLNAMLPAGAPRYDSVAMKDLADGGRHISPGVIARVPIDHARLLGHRQRILETTVTVNGHSLILLAAHWTSQLSDDGSRKTGGRNGYARVIEETYEGLVRGNPAVDFLVCGDFNDTPDSEPVRQTLHMVSDYHKAGLGEVPPRLFGLLSGRPASDFGTIYYKKPLIYDQIGISPGMYDNVGWGYDPSSVRVPTDGLIEPGAHGRHPWRFGSPKDSHRRGYSDHFPVTVMLKVAP